MACDLSIVMGDPVAVSRYATLLSASLTRTRPETGTLVEDIIASDQAGDLAASTDRAHVEMVAAELVADIVPVADSVWAAGQKSIMDYAMAGMQLAKIRQDWQTALKCAQLAARVNSDEPAVVEGMAEARAALRNIDDHRKII